MIQKLLSASILLVCLLVTSGFETNADPSTSKPEGGVPIKGQRVVFNAITGTFTKKPNLKANKPVTVVILNPNIFREKYTVKVQTTDFHNAGIPTALSSLIISTAPASGGAGEERGVLADPLSDKRLQEAYQAYHEALRNFNAYMEEVPTSDQIVGMIRQGGTNFDIRNTVLQAIHRGVEGHDTAKNEVTQLVSTELCPGQADDPQVFRDIKDSINEVATELVDRAQGLFGALEGAKNGWEIAWFMLDPPPTNGPDFLANRQVNATFEAAQTRIANLHVVRHLYVDFFLSPLVFPTRIVTSPKTINADVVTVNIQVDQAPSAVLAINPQNDKDTINKILSQDSTVMSRTYSTKLRVYGRWVRDFSAGYVSTSLKQRNFFVDKTVTPNVVRLGASEKRNQGVGVLFQTYPTTRNPLGLTVGPCLGVSTTDPARFLFGGSIIAHLSDQVRLSFSYGCAYGEVTELNGDTLNNPPNDTSPATASVSRKGVFRSLTLSLSF